MVIAMSYNNLTQHHLDKIQAVFGIDAESEIYTVIGNILSYLSQLPEEDRTKPLSYDGLRIAAGIINITEMDTEKVNMVKIAAFMLSDPNIGVFEQIFDVIDADSGKVQNFSFKELCSCVRGGGYTHPITKQQISAETFSKVVIVYFVTTTKFWTSTNQ